MIDMWHDAIQFSLKKIEAAIPMVEDWPDRCYGPEWGYIGKTKLSSNWVDGFWVGQLWLAYAYTKDPKFEAAAREWTERVAWLKTTLKTHDLGFLFYLSNVMAGYATGDDSLFENAMTAAETFTARWNPRGEYLLAWGNVNGTNFERRQVNIDLMMNLSLLFWATAHSGDPKYAQIATRHARTCRLTLVRPNGSTAPSCRF